MDLPALRLSGLARRFPTHLGLRRRTVLEGIDLELEQGGSLALVGPNGSGKSTLLRLIAGVDRPSAGQVEVLGASPARAGVRRRLAYLPENSPFPPELSARAALDLLGALSGLGRREIRERGARLLEQVGLATHAHRTLRTYSRGMLRRFGLAQAFLSQPEVVLLDEPTAGLDAQGYGVLDDLLEEAKARGTTLVLASHLPEDILDRCRSLLLLQEGRIAAQGTPAELLPLLGEAQVEIEGLSSEDLDALTRWIQERGGQVRALRPSSRSLFALYQRTRRNEKGKPR